MLPFLSGTLAEILNEMSDEGNPIAKHLVYINSLVEDSINLKYHIPYRLMEVIEQKIINSELTREVMMLSVRVGSDDANISFLPKDKLPEYTDEGTWARKNRQEGKPAKIFQKAITKEFKQQEWEIFSNAFKAAVCNCNKFEVVSGEQIRYWYDEHNYYQVKGTLGNSCMRYTECQPYFDVYVDHAKMLISLKDGKLTGRAIVWELNGKTYLDRVYTCYDYLLNCFLDYAKERKWLIRQDNALLSTGEVQYWKGPDDNYENAFYEDLSINLNKTYEYFPYMDSLRYYDSSSDRITTDNDDAYCSLDRTDGNWEECDIYCDSCGRRFRGYDEDDLPDGLHWSEWYDGYLCDDCCFWSDYLEDYIPNNVEHTLYKRINSYGHRDCFVPNETLSENVLTCPNDGDSGFVKINNEWYEYNSQFMEFDSDSNSYKLKAECVTIQTEYKTFSGTFSELLSSGTN